MKTPVSRGWPLLLLATCLMLGGRALAQSPAPARDPAGLAEATLGELPGVVAVGVLQGGRMQVAVRRRDRVGAAMETVTALPDGEPIFEIGSISKVFTGLLVAQRVEHGELRLDDTIGHLMQGRASFRYDAVSTIQVRHLLTHKACLRRWPATFTPQGMFEQAAAYDSAQLWDMMGHLVLGRTPPCETRYSNVGYAVLGDLVALRSHRPWEALVVEEIARPLELADTRQHLSAAQQARVAAPWTGGMRSRTWEGGAFAPAGGLRSTATDLLVFSQALLQGRAGPLGAGAERLVTELATFGENGARIGYAVLMPPGPGRIWLHNGETRAYNSEWIVWPELREAVVILASNKAARTGQVRRELVAGTWTGSIHEVVYTRGEFRGTFVEDGGRRLYARVKLAPGVKLPFSTLTYRVLDAKLVSGLAAGAEVDFRAERIAGENVITEMRLPPK